MGNNLNDNELIEWYLLGKLSDADIRTFKDRLYDDREFARKYRLIKNFPELMSEQGRREFEKIRIEKEVTNVRERTFRVQKRKHILWAVAAVMVLAAVAIFFIMNWKDRPEESKVKIEKIDAKTTVVKQPVPALKDSSQIKKVSENKIEEVSAAAEVEKQKAKESINPVEGGIFSRKDTIRFNWKQKADTFERFCICLESRDQVILWRGVRPGIREFKVPGSYLLPGKYYWYVGSKEDRHTFSISE